jgi:hypothetical protein
MSSDAVEEERASESEDSKGFGDKIMSKRRGLLTRRSKAGM